MCTIHTTAHNILLHITYCCTLYVTAPYIRLHATAHYIRCIHLHTIYLPLHTYTAHYSTLHILLQTAGVKGLVVTGGETEPRPGPTNEQ
jgi:hypothetical protein